MLRLPAFRPELDADARAIVFTGSGLMGREIENIRSCDLVVFMGGRSGTLLVSALFSSSNVILASRGIRCSQC